MSAPVASKAAYKTEPLGPFRRACSLVLLCPFHRQRNGNPYRAPLSEKRGELDQAHLCVYQFESQTAAQFNVLLDLFAPCSHRAPPGQGKANAASEGRSTLA